MRTAGFLVLLYAAVIGIAKSHDLIAEILALLRRLF